MGLQVIRPADPLFDRLMNYRYYRLIKQSRRRGANSTLDAAKRFKALSLALDNQTKFDGTDPMTVFEFLTRVTEEADLNGFDEGQLFPTLPRLLSGIAEGQFRASRSGSRSGGV